MGSILCIEKIKFINIAQGSGGHNGNLSVILYKNLFFQKSQQIYKNGQKAQKSSFVLNFLFVLGWGVEIVFF